MRKPVPGGRKEGRHGLFMPQIIGILQTGETSAALTAGLQEKQVCCER